MDHAMLVIVEDLLSEALARLSVAVSFVDDDDDDDDDDDEPPGSRLCDWTRAARLNADPALMALQRQLRDGG